MFLILYIFSVVVKQTGSKGFVWEKDGFLLLYKRLEKGNFMWPRNESDVRALTSQQFRWLMEGLTISPKKTVQEIQSPEHMA
ncbi:MAG: IS66 family insertion sequence element accessory protein TnpB [Blautia sp.]